MQSSKNAYLCPVWKEACCQSAAGSGANQPHQRPPRWRKTLTSAILAPFFQPESLMYAILIVAFLAVCIIIPRYYANYPWAWAISLTVWLTVARAHFIFFIALWLVCWAAREKIWRDTYLVAPIENLVKRILH